MANVKITDLAALTNPATTDVLPIVDVNTDVTKKVSVGEIVGKISGDVTVGTDGTAAITGGVIVNADVNGSAAIAGTKIDPDFGSQTVETTGVINAGSGTAAAPAVTVGTTDNGLYSPGLDQVAISTNGAQALYINSDGDILVADGNRMEIDEIRARDGDGLKLFDDGGAGIFVADGGNVGLGNSDPRVPLDVYTTTQFDVTESHDTNTLNLTLISGGTEGDDEYSAGVTFSKINSTRPGAAINAVQTSADGDRLGLSFLTHQALTPSNELVEQVRITHDGQVGIGTTSPGSALEIDAAAATSPFIAKINTNEAARIDSSGRLLIGTSTPLSNVYIKNNEVTPQLQLQGTSVGGSAFSITREAGAASNLILQRGSTGNPVVLDDTVGQINFNGFDGTNYRNTAQVLSEVDGTPSTGDMPGRLVFSSTPSGSATPVERLRITSAGVLQIADAGDIAVGTTTGTKIGTATSQKIGFYNATPVVQPTAVADITTTATSGSLPTPDGSVTIADAATPTVTELLEYCVELEAKLEAALGHLRTLGLIAT